MDRGGIGIIDIRERAWTGRTGVFKIPTVRRRETDEDEVCNAIASNAIRLDDSRIRGSGWS